MSIASGYQKFKDYIKQTAGSYILASRWANANTLECDDGKTLQTKVGGINGITSSKTANAEDIAASAKLTNELYSDIASLSSELGGYRFVYTEEGQPGYKKDSADTVYPFSSSVNGSFSVSVFV